MFSRLFTASVAFIVLTCDGLRPVAAQTALPDSPFLPPGKAQISADPTPSDALQLAGISVLGKNTFISLFDPGTQRSRWIAVGKRVDGIEVVSCDLAAEQALIRMGGQTKLLTLRKTAVSSEGRTSAKNPAAGASVASPFQPAAPLTTQAEQEREARMFVSDLLEIGMHQRKTYEELQRKAAAKEAAEQAPKS